MNHSFPRLFFSKESEAGASIFVSVSIYSLGTSERSELTFVIISKKVIKS